MALLLAGAIGKVSGRLGGVEIAQVGGRGVIKRSKGRQSAGGPDRIEAQAFLGGQIAAWRALTDARKKTWEDAARTRPRADRLGTKRCISGYQLYMSMPHWPLVFGVQPRWYIPPTIPLPVPAEATITITAPGTLDFDITTMTELAGWMVQIQIGRFQPLTGNRNCYTWKSLGSLPCVPDHNSWDAVLTAKNIAFIAGERVAVKWTAYTQYHWMYNVDAGKLTVG
jgi:hypothetical protein